MNIKSVIKQVAGLLQLSNVLNADLDNYNQLDSQTKKDVNIILSSINEVLCDISTEYLPQKYTETINVTTGSYSFQNLSKNFHKLIKINTKNNYSINFETLIIPNGKYDITYTYIPDEYELDDDIEDFSSKLTIYALSYGVAAEFCLISGNYSESEMWNSRFENSMRVASKLARVPCINKRRWI